jgi:hypothetical protein
MVTAAVVWGTYKKQNPLTTDPVEANNRLTSLVMSTNSVFTLVFMVSSMAQYSCRVNVKKKAPG